MKLQQCIDFLKKNPKVALTLDAEELRDLLSGIRILNQEILYYLGPSEIPEYNLFTTASSNSKAVVFSNSNVISVSKDSFDKLRHGIEKPRGQFIVQRSGNLRLVKTDLMSIDLTSQDFINEAKAYKVSNGDLINRGNTTQRKTFGQRLWNIAKWGTLIGAGYILLKRWFSGNECHETWIHKTDFLIGTESRKFNTISRMYHTDSGF